MNDRIILFMKVKNLSAAELADEIGVQRSAVSHLLSGRNNPSLGFMQKILEHYPDIRSEWLIMGKGSMFYAKDDNLSADDVQPISKSVIRNPEPDLFDTAIEDVLPEEVINKSNVEPQSIHLSSKMLEKDEVLVDPELKENSIAADTLGVGTEMIVIFLSDGTFRTYRPAK